MCACSHLLHLTTAALVDAVSGGGEAPRAAGLRRLRWVVCRAPRLLSFVRERQGMEQLFMFQKAALVVASRLPNEPGQRRLKLRDYL